MNITRTNKTSTQVNLVILADEADIKPLKDHALEHLASKVKVPGFREGKAPLAVIEKHVDQTTLVDEFTEEALNTLYMRALEQEDLRPVGNPNVTILKFVPFTTLEFQVELEIIGTVKLPDYKKIKLAKKPAGITAEEVNNVIESLQKQLAKKEEKTGAIVDGDEAIIDFIGSTPAPSL